MARGRKPQARISRWFERVALGAIMGLVAFVVERRLAKALRRRGEGTSEDADQLEAELSAAPQDIDQ